MLVIEDQAAVAASIRSMLEARNFAANVVSDGKAGLEHLLRPCYDLAVVDVGLPVMDGLTLTRTVRAVGVQTPILMLTARDSVEDRVAGLNSGADDYLVKPFVEEELVARITAILRRGERPMRQVVKAGALRVDLTSKTASFDGKALVLTPTEFRLLELLARNANILLSRQQIVECIWDHDFDGISNNVDVFVSMLRQKLKKQGASDIIETVWRVGYGLRA